MDTGGSELKRVGLETQNRRHKTKYAIRSSETHDEAQNAEWNTKNEQNKTGSFREAQVDRDAS
jgi:hypothetical protein